MELSSVATDALPPNESFAKRVLVLEDVTVLGDLIEELLQEHGYEVRLVADTTVAFSGALHGAGTQNLLSVAKQVGAHNALQRPFSPGELIEKIKTAEERFRATTLPGDETDPMSPV